MSEEKKNTEKPKVTKTLDPIQEKEIGLVNEYLMLQKPIVVKDYSAPPILHPAFTFDNYKKLYSSTQEFICGLYREKFESMVEAIRKKEEEDKKAEEVKEAKEKEAENKKVFTKSYGEDTKG